LLVVLQPSHPNEEVRTLLDSTGLVKVTTLLVTSAQPLASEDIRALNFVFLFIFLLVSALLQRPSIAT
jgi:hypothetical protein